MRLYAFRFLVGIGCCVSSITGITGGASAGNSVKSPLIVALKARPLEEVVSRLGAGADHSVQPAIAAKRATVFVHPGKEDVARTKLADLLGYRWTSTGGRQQLEQSQERSQQAQKLREKSISAAREALERRLLLCMRVLQGDRKALRSLEVLDWRTAALITQGTLGKRAEVLRFLTLLDIKKLIHTGYWMSRPLGSTSAEVRSAALLLGPSGVTVAVPEGQGRATEAQIREASRMDQRDLAARCILLEMYGDPEDPGVRGGLVNPLPLNDPQSNQRFRESLRFMLLHPIAPDVFHDNQPLPFLDRPGPDMDQPELQQRISLADPVPAGEKHTYPQRLEEVLEEIANRSGLNVIADSYQSSRNDYLSWGTPLVDVPLWRVLRQIRYDFNYEAKVQDGWLLLRHARWPFEESSELSEPLLADLDQEVKDKKGISYDSMLNLALKLTRPQFENLARIYPELRRNPLPYSSLRILGTLSPLQKHAVESGEGLPVGKLTPNQQQELKRILASQRPYLDEPQVTDLRMKVTRWGPMNAPILRFIFAQGDQLNIAILAHYPIRGVTQQLLSQLDAPRTREVVW